MLGFIFAVMVIGRPHQIVGQVLLCHPAVREIVRVEVMLPLLRDLGAIVVDILQAAGEAFPLSLLDIRQGSVDCNIGGIGFGGGGKQNGGFRQRDPCFGKTELHGGIYTCLNNGNSLRIRQSDILTSNNQQTAAGGQQIAGFKQPSEIVDSSIGVRAANGFL